MRVALGLNGELILNGYGKPTILQNVPDCLYLLVSVAKINRCSNQSISSLIERGSRRQQKVGLQYNRIRSLCTYSSTNLPQSG